MSTNKEHLYRQWALLLKIPIRPSAKTAKQLTEELLEDGFVVSKRTVERDLSDLKNSPFGISSDEQGVGNNSNRWFFERDSKLHMLPAMSMQMAFTLLFSVRMLKDMLPPTVLQLMQTILNKAESTLRSSKNTYKHWDQYIKHIPRTLPLIPAKIKDGILDTCLNATINSHQLEVTYKPRYDDQKKYHVNPLGLVYRDSVVYLVCTLWRYTDIKQIALHRISQITSLSNNKCIKPKGFDLEYYISNEGAFLYGQSPGKHIKIELKFDSDTVLHLEETPLSADQKVTHKGEYSLLSATVMDTSQLRWWLLGFGQYVEVLKPKKLRDEFNQIANSMVKHYS